MKIDSLEVLVIGDAADVDPDKGGVEPLACILVKAEGLCGLAEVFRVPPGVVQATVGGPATHFGRLLLGQELTHPARLWQRMWDALVHTNRRGWEIIILGALDVALWDLYGQALGQPLWRLLGGIQRGEFHTHSQTPTDKVVPYCTIVSDVWGGEAMIRQQAARVEQLAALGYLAFKVEPMMSTPRDIVELARLARRIIGPDLTLMVDVGYLFHDVPTAARVCRALEDFDIYFFETPFPVDHPEPYARLAALTKIPLAMGEHGVTRWEFLDMIERGRVSVAQPYLMTCGGITEALRIVEIAQARGALVCPGNWSTQIHGAALVHFAAWSPISPFVEFAPAEVYDSPLRKELQAAGPEIRGGQMHLPTGPGVGFRLSAEVVRGFRLD